MKLGVGQRRVARWVAWGAILFVGVGVMAGCGGASGQNTGTNKQTPEWRWVFDSHHWRRYWRRRRCAYHEAV